VNLERFTVGFKILWRWILNGLLWGAVGGAAFGTLLSPILGTIIGSAYGALLGLGLGIANGLILGLITAVLFVPVDHKEESYALFTVVVSCIVTLVGMVVGLAVLYGIQDTGDISSLGGSAVLLFCVPVVLAVIAAVWRASKIADRYINPPDEEGYDV
jgi:hypothetical protein